MDDFGDIHSHTGLDALETQEFGYAVLETVDRDGILHTHVFRRDVAEQETAMWEKIDSIQVDESAVLENE